MSGLFRDLEDFDDDNGQWDTSALTDMSFMFYGAKNIQQTHRILECVTDTFQDPMGLWVSQT